MIYKLMFVVILFILTTKVSLAQVTIGLSEAPVPGALLQLKSIPNKDNEEVNSTKGIMMPRVSLTRLDAISDIPGAIGQEVSHVGLIVYNVTKQEVPPRRICPGLHIWTGNEWKPLEPYPNVLVGERSKTNYIAKINSFTFLDPNSTDNWPADKNPANYPLGYIGTYTDNRDNSDVRTYEYTRFYVGIANKTISYDLYTSYSCDENNIVYNKYRVTEDPVDVFEDGTWFGQSLKAKIYDPKRDDPTEYVGTIVPQENQGVASNNYSTWNYVAENPTKEDQGLLYSPGAAINAFGNEERIYTTDSYNYSVEYALPIQGICPSGWHIPSIREYTDLFNGIASNASLFSSGTNYTGDLLSYSSTTKPSSLDQYIYFSPSWTVASGKSRQANQGGANFEGAGMFCWNPVVWSYDKWSFFITSNNTGTWWLWGQFNMASGGSIEKRYSNFSSSVRCRKND